MNEFQTWQQAPGTVRSKLGAPSSDWGTSTMPTIPTIPIMLPAVSDGARCLLLWNPASYGLAASSLFHAFSNYSRSRRFFEAPPREDPCHAGACVPRRRRLPFLDLPTGCATIVVTIGLDPIGRVAAKKAGGIVFGESGIRKERVTQP